MKPTKTQCLHFSLAVFWNNAVAALLLMTVLSGCCTVGSKRSGTAGCVINHPVREDIEWSRSWVPGLNHSDKPHVLLIGDSITEAYSGVVEKELEGKAYVARLATSKSLGDPAYLQEVELVVGHVNFQVIHFNNGMHGTGYSEAEYGRDYPKLIAILKRSNPDATLICATTTPQRASHHLDQLTSFTDRIKARNAIAVGNAQAGKIQIDDLFGLVENHPDYYSDDGTHFNSSGVEIEGKQVARVIQSALSASK